MKDRTLQYDAVLGDKNPLSRDSLVLGRIAGLKQRPAIGDQISDRN